MKSAPPQESGGDSRQPAGCPGSNTTHFIAWVHKFLAGRNAFLPLNFGSNENLEYLTQRVTFFFFFFLFLFFFCSNKFASSALSQELEAKQQGKNNQKHRSELPRHP